MPNKYFQFKYFRIDQDKTTMKVGTDGMLLGAWTNCEKAGSILDIGTGTGLIALMLAQRNQLALIDAIDIDKNAFLQAKENFLNSPWNNRLQVFNISFQDYIKECRKKYDLIVSNPPFFKNSLLSVDKLKILARHQVFLNLNDLVHGVSFLLNDHGKFYLIIPIESYNDMIREAITVGLYCNHILNIKPTIKKHHNRIIMVFEKESGKLKKEEIIIWLNSREYTNDYMNLTKEFYLNF